MKKLTLVLILALILTACGTDTTDASAPPAAEAPEVTEAAAPAATEAPATEATEPPATEAPRTEAPRTDEIASRKNPAQFGQTVVMEAEYGGDPIHFEITLSDLVRGEEAYDRMIADNQFNEINDDEEVIYVTVDFKLIQYENADDNPFPTSRYDFDYHKSDYTSYRSNNFIVVENQFEGDMYEGGHLTGTLGVVIPEGESGYLLFHEFMWFEIPE